jgi:hypothetical protein
MINLTPDQIKQITELIDSNAYNESEESGTVSIEFEITLNDEPYLVVGDVEVERDSETQEYSDRDMQTDVNIEFAVVDFEELQLQHLHDEDDVQILDFTQFKKHF